MLAAQRSITRAKSYGAFLNRASRTTRSCNSQLLLTWYASSPRHSGSLLMTTYAPARMSSLCNGLRKTISPILNLCVMKLFHSTYRTVTIAHRGDGIQPPSSRISRYRLAAWRAGSHVLRIFSEAHPALPLDRAAGAAEPLTALLTNERCRSMPLEELRIVPR
jgi:hypothetical protein